MSTNDVFHLVTVLLGLLSTWMMFYLRNQRECLQTLERRINELEIRSAVLQHETKNINEVLNSLSGKLDDLHDKIGDVLALRPLLESVRSDVSDMRKARL